MQTVASVSWLYQLLPSAISVFLIPFSTCLTRVLEKQIDEHPYRCVNEQGDAKDFAKVMAKSWVTQVGFQTAMIAAFASAIVAAIAVLATDPLKVMPLVLVIVGMLATHILWTVRLSRERAQDIHEGWFSTAQMLNLTLIVVNVMIASIIVLNDDNLRATILGWFAGLWIG